MKGSNTTEIETVSPRGLDLQQEAEAVPAGADEAPVSPVAVATEGEEPGDQPASDPAAADAGASEQDSQ